MVKDLKQSHELTNYSVRKYMLRVLSQYMKA